MFSYELLVAKINVDTVENGPSHVWMRSPLSLLNTGLFVSVFCFGCNISRLAWIS